jgi:hypothetical protein
MNVDERRTHAAWAIRIAPFVASAILVGTRHMLSRGANTRYSGQFCLASESSTRDFMVPWARRWEAIG